MTLSPSGPRIVGELAVLHGGPSSEHDISVITSRGAIAALRRAGHRVHAVWVDRGGLWHFGGLEADAGTAVSQPMGLLAALERLAQMQLVCAFLGFHGTYGEDGRIQAALSLAGVPYSGSEMTASAVAMDKPLARRVLSAAGLDVPAAVELDTLALGTPDAVREAAQRVVETLGLPVVLKVSAGGSSIGVEIPATPEQVEAGLERLRGQAPVLLCETHVAGIELTAGVLARADGSLEALPIVEIAPKGEGFFDFEAKYRPELTDEIVPARISARDEARAREIGLIAHRALGCRAVSRTDLILSESGQIWVLETNTLPGLTPASLLPKAAASVGCDYIALLERIIAPSVLQGRSAEGQTAR